MCSSFECTFNVTMYFEGRCGRISYAIVIGTYDVFDMVKAEKYS